MTCGSMPVQKGVTLDDDKSDIKGMDYSKSLDIKGNPATQCSH
jgi:hypothetical protein